MRATYRGNRTRLRHVKALRDWETIDASRSTDIMPAPARHRIAALSAPGGKPATIRVVVQRVVPWHKKAGTLRLFFISC